MIAEEPVKVQTFFKVANVIEMLMVIWVCLSTINGELDILTQTLPILFVITMLVFFIYVVNTYLKMLKRA
jgi:hypothetical protein